MGLNEAQETGLSNGYILVSCAAQMIRLSGGNSKLLNFNWS